MSDTDFDFAGQGPNWRGLRRGQPTTSANPNVNTPATTTLVLVGVAWLISLVTGLQEGLSGYLISGMLLLAAISMGFWGLRRAKRHASATKRRAVAGLVIAVVTLPIPVLWLGRGLRESASLSYERHLLAGVGFGLHQQHDNSGFLAPNVYDPETKTFNSGLSWRVQVLPFIMYWCSLEEHFRLNEPWDGPHNRRFANERASVFASPFDPPGTTQTRYHIFVGGGSMFEYGKQTQLKDITDGTGNTIMVAEAREAAPWPKPFDLSYSPDQPIPPLGREDAKGFMVVMADGSVRFVRKGVSEATLRAAITAAGNDMLGPDW